MMKLNAWTVALVGIGMVSLPAVLRAEEKVSSNVITALSATTLSGYVDTSAQWNIGTGNANTPTYSFGGSTKADGFNLNVVKLSLEKPIDPQAGWAAGYKVDLLAGPDANTFATQSAQSLGTAADFGIKQAYVALRAPVGNGLDFKMGVWDTLIGYEVFDSASNPNFTRSYGYTIEPVTHTGVLASYAFADYLSANVGVANTHGPNINSRAHPTGVGDPRLEGPKAESYKTYMTSLVLTAPQSWGFLAGSTLTGCVINGFNNYAGADQTSWYVGTLLNTPVSGLKVGFAYDYSGISEQDISPAAYANAVAAYASYQATEKLSFHARGEYATSDTAVFGASKVVAVTGTLQYDLWANVLSRLEVRWDHAADGSTPYGGSVPGDGDKKNSVIVMANLVYKF